MGKDKITALMQELGDSACCIIYQSPEGVKVRYTGATQNVLPTLRAGIKADELLRAACCDVVDECVMPALHLCLECPMTVKL